MSNKLKANFTVNIEKVLERVNSYPHISKAIQPQLEEISQFKQSPLIEQVHEVIYWLHRYTETSKLLLNELERVLIRIEEYEFNGKENLLNKFGMVKDKANFNSAYSELYLANFFIKSGIIKLLEFEPLAKGGEKRADFRICLGAIDLIVELKTPRELSIDFEEKADFLFKKLELIQSGSLSIEVSGFESYDSSNLWRTPVEP